MKLVHTYHFQFNLERQFKESQAAALLPKTLSFYFLFDEELRCVVFYLIVNVVRRMLIIIVLLLVLNCVFLTSGKISKI